MPRPSPTRIAELLDAYLLTDYHWQRGGEWRRIEPGKLAPEPDAAFPQVRRYGLVTAWNPNSVAREEAINRADDEHLRQTLAQTGHACHRSLASTPDGSWSEPGWLVIDLPVAHLDALARQFGQLGALAWERGQLVRLRIYAKRPPGVGRHACVDWITG